MMSDESLPPLSTTPCDTGSRARDFVPGLRSELREAAWNHGYRSERGEADGWLYFASDINVPGEVGLAVAEDGSAWFLAIEHAGVASELGSVPATPVPHGKRAAFGFATRTDFRRALHRSYDLACSLPSVPLYEYQAEVAELGDTETERLAKQRIGQDVFRRALMRYWGNRCPLTGISEPQLLRASHIVPWAECASDAERLDVHNGLLLSAHWDAAFDAGLVSFSDDGLPLAKAGLSAAAASVLDIESVPPLVLTDDHRRQLSRHRKHHLF